MKSFTFVRLARLSLYACALTLLVLGAVSKRGLFDLKRMRDENSSVKSKLQNLELQKVELEEQIRRFETESPERERVVRLVLGYIKPNETVIEFE